VNPGDLVVESIWWKHAYNPDPRHVGLVIERVNGQYITVLWSGGWVQEWLEDRDLTLYQPADQAQHKSERSAQWNS
jgi:hypothetical protein